MKSSMIALILCLSQFLVSHAFGKDLTPEMASYEEKIKKEIESQQIDKKRLFYLYTLAGRELLNYRYYEKAEEYFLKAKDLKLDENHTEIFLELIPIALAQKDKSKIEKTYKEAVAYFEKNPKFKDKNIDEYLRWVKVTYLERATPEEKLAAKRGRFGHFLRLNDVIDRIKNKKYEAALAGMNPQALKDASISYKIIYDVTNVMVHKREARNILCQEMYKRNPSAYSYSVKICGILLNYLKDGKVSQEKLANLEDYFKHGHQEKKYLYQALKELAP